MIGTTLSHYYIEEQIGEGGMGVVYRAQDTLLRRYVALKLLLPAAMARPDRRKRLLHEARAASRLNHPNIVTIFEVGVQGDDVFIAMELLKGRTLDQLIGKPLDAQQAVRIAIQVADGLTCAEENGIVHRDMKPSNVFLLDSGLVKIVDFGLAKNAPGTGDATATVLTNDGIVIGTPSYMSPEQAEGKEVDSRSDIFSFGILLYEMLTGKRAFERTSSLASVIAVLHEDPPPASLPPGFDIIVRCCLEKNPDRRYQRATALRSALEDLRYDMQSQPSRLMPRAEVGRQPSRTIAVLPFTDMSPQKDQDYFCDGIAEEIINALTTIEGLRVGSRTSSFRFKEQSLDIAEIGRQLKVDNVLEGSVRSHGDRLRITAQLIDVHDGYHLWSSRYDRQLADIFAIQDEIAQAIVDTFRLHLDRAQAAKALAKHSVDAGAYQLYLQGRYHWNKRTVPSVRRAIEFFEKAIQRDPEYLLAYSGLADCYSTYNYYGALAPFELRDKARQAARKALELGGAQSDPHSSMGLVAANFDYDVTAAENHFRRAIEINPNNSTAHYFHAFSSLAAQGRFEEAIAETQKALSLEPLSLPILTWKGAILYLSRQFERSIEEYLRVIELDPAFVRARLEIALPYFAVDRIAEGLDSLEEARELVGDTPRGVSLRGYGSAIARHRDEAEESLMELELLAQSVHVNSYERAIVYAGLGQKASAVEALWRAYEERSPWMIFLEHLPLWDVLRGEEGFARIVQAMRSHWSGR